MQIEIGSNPNCAGSEQFVFNELEGAKPVVAIRVSEGTKESLCDVTGVEESGRFVEASAVKIADSGNGVAYLIYGGAWGIRLRPEAHRNESWDLSNTSQWGEPFKIYGSEEDLVYV